MSHFLRFLGPILGSILRSLLVSLIMFVIFFSIMTRKFPPHLSDLTQMAKLTQQILEVPKMLNSISAKNPHSMINDETAMVTEVETMNKKRAQLSRELLSKLGQGGPSQIKDFSDVESQLRQMNDRLERIETNLELIRSQGR